MDGADQPELFQGEEQFLGQFIPLHYHFNMLQDQARTGAFRAAIQAVVRPGMKVLELGGGTGVLSFFAAEQGAEVLCVERNRALVRKARELTRLNNVDSQVEVIHDDAALFTPSEPVDLVICEMLHVGLLREKQLQVIDAFKQNYLSAGFDKLPAFMPDCTMLAVQPIEFDFKFEGYNAPLPLFQDAMSSNIRTQTLAELCPYETIYYEENFPQEFNWQGRIPVTADGCFNAVRFMTQNLLGQTAAKEPVTWANQLLASPLQSAVEVTAGDFVDVQFSYQAGQPLESLTSSLTAGRSAGLQRRAA